MHFESDIDERSVCVPKFNNVGKVIEMQNIIREHEHEKKMLMWNEHFYIRN